MLARTLGRPRRVAAALRPLGLARSVASSRMLQAAQPPRVELPSELRERVRVAPLAATYDPEAVERGWQEYWQRVVKQHAPTFGSEQERKAKTFSMILPPPNVTGALHIGHALTITIQDAIARWHRMRGFDVRWLPGLDHAGIATQVLAVAVESALLWRLTGGMHGCRVLWSANCKRSRDSPGTTSGATRSWTKCGRGTSSTEGESCSRSTTSALS